MDNPPGQSSLPAKRKVGRPNDRIWDHFEKGIKRPGSCRHPGKCTYCHVVIEDGRPENLYKHIVKCDSVPAQVRLEYTELQAKRLEAQRALSLTKKPKLSAEFVPVGEVSLAGSPGTVRPPKMPGSSQPRRMADKPVHATNVSLLRMLITSSQPFALIKNPYFAAFVRALCPEYSLPDVSTLSTTLLQEEYAKVRAAIGQKIEKAKDFTLSTVAWTTASGRPMCTTRVSFIDRAVELLAIKDITEFAAALGENMAGYIAEAIQERIGDPNKVAFLCTDNSSVMVNARRLLSELPDFNHIIGVRCMLQAFRLQMSLMVSHPWARALAVKAQKLVTHFRTVAWSAQLLQEVAGALNIPGPLQSCSTSTLASLHTCMESVLALRVPLEALVAQQHAAALLPGWLTELVEDGEFWDSLACLCQLLSPCIQLRDAMKAENLILADFMRYWVYLGGQLAKANPSAACVATGYVQQCFYYFNKRYLEMDVPLCRLALYLDPRYKDAVCSLEKGDIADLLKEGLTLLRKRRFSKEEALRFRNQLYAYRSGDSPYDTPWGGPSFRLKEWWQMVSGPATMEICAVATLLCDLVPYTAALEDAFSLQTEFDAGVTQQLSVPMRNMVDTIRNHYVQQQLRPTSKASLKSSPGAVAPLATPARAESRGAATSTGAAEEAGLSEEACSPELLDLVLESTYSRSENEEAAVNPHTGVFVDASAIPTTELLIGNDFDLNHSKFSPASDAEAMQPTPARSRMGESAEGFDIDAIMALADSGK